MVPTTVLAPSEKWNEDAMVPPRRRNFSVGRCEVGHEAVCLYRYFVSFQFQYLLT